MYEEQVSLTVAQHKGLPEIEKNAKREIAKMQRVSEGKYGYIVMQNGQSLTEFKYAQNKENHASLCGLQKRAAFNIGIF